MVCLYLTFQYVALRWYQRAGNSKYSTCTDSRHMTFVIQNCRAAELWRAEQTWLQMGIALEAMPSGILLALLEQLCLKADHYSYEPGRCLSTRLCLSCEADLISEYLYWYWRSKFYIHLQALWNPDLICQFRYAEVRSASQDTVWCCKYLPNLVLILLSFKRYTWSRRAPSIPDGLTYTRWLDSHI